MNFFYEVELRNKRGDLLEYLDRDISSISWSYDAVGGCGQADIALRREFDNYGDLGRDYDIRIWRAAETVFSPPGAALTASLPMALGGPAWATRELRWRGFIRAIRPVLDQPERVLLNVSGYSRQLAYVMVPERTYSGDAGAIARSVIDEYVLPGTQIKRTGDLHLCDDTGVVAQNLTFDTSAFEVLRSLAEIGGNPEWGVRADGEIYFKPRSSEVKQTVVIGDRIKFHESETSTDEEVTRVFLRGANDLRAVLTFGDYQPGYQKERIVFAPFITGAADATLWGISYKARFGTPQPKGRVLIGASDGWIEGIGHPMGRLRIIGGTVFMKAGAVLTAALPMQLAETMGGITDQSYRVHSIRYAPTDSGLDIGIDLGEKGSPLADLHQSIAFQLSALRQGVQ